MITKLPARACLAGNSKNLVFLAISLIENKKLVKAIVKAIITFFISLLGLSTVFVNDSPNATYYGTYGAQLCNKPGFECIKVQKG